MKVGGPRGLRGTAVALALAVCAAGCAAEETPDESAGATAAPSPSTSPAAEAPPEVLIAKAFRQMQVAFKRKDARTAVREMAPLSVKYLKETRRLTATAGPSKIAKQTVWQKLVVTMLRTDHHVDLLEGLSPEGFLDYVFSYDLNYFPSARLEEDAVEITGPRTAVAVIGRSPVWFELVDGEWRVDVRGVFESLSFFTKRFAKREGMTTDEVIRVVAEERTTGAVTQDVWDKPQ